MLKENIAKIVENGNKKDMECLSDIMIEVLEDLEKYDKEVFEDYNMAIYIMANGKVLTKEMAEKIILKMKPYGMHWTFEDTEDVRKSNSINNIRDVDFWIVMNHAYNDQHSLCEEDLDKYITYTKNFILDPDAKKAKVFIYFTEIPE